MSPQNLKNQDLDSKIKSLAQQERELLHEVLMHIHEADRRKLYLELAYPNLFVYLTEACGYSAGAAHRRIDAVRLMRDVPEVGKKIESGELSLSQVSLLQKTIRQTNSQKKISVETKRQLIESMYAKSIPESQKLIAKTLDLEVKDQHKETHQKDESVRLEVTFSKEEWEKIKKMREYLSPAIGNGCWSSMFSHLAEKVIRQKEGSSRKQDKQDISYMHAFTSTVEVNAPEAVPKAKTIKSEHASTRLPNKPAEATRTRSYIPIITQRFVLNKYRACQYKSKHTGKMCGSRWNLQIDHIQPVWAQGTNDPHNLQILCGNHNLFKYRKESGLV